jgi:hypothetical protein
VANRLEAFAADIATFGWMVMKVSAKDAADPDFAYSIGFHQSYEHPEIIIVGLPLEIAHQVINDVGASVRGGARYAAGSMSDEFLEKYSVTFRAVPDYQYGAYLGWGRRYYGERAFPVLQLVFPDRAGRWPWHEEASPEFRTAQPILADTPEPPWAREPAV